MIFVQNQYIVLLWKPIKAFLLLYFYCNTFPIPTGEMSRHKLKAAENLLRDRNFETCRKYALEQQQSDPSNATVASQIIAISEVMAAADRRFGDGRPDWYAILGVSRYSDDSQLLRVRFKELISLINPNKNKFPFADSAFVLVRDAWMVLSDPTRKALFDNELQIFESKGKDDQRSGAAAEDTFWTACPYCYYVYEYPNVYKDCCLRCRNEKCKRGFEGVPIRSPPPAEIAKSGEYLCLGFCPIVFQGQNEKRVSIWTPFTPPNPNVGKEDDSSSTGFETEEVKEVVNIGKPSRKRKKSLGKWSVKVDMDTGIRVKTREKVMTEDSAESGDDEETFDLWDEEGLFKMTD